MPDSDAPEATPEITETVAPSVSTAHAAETLVEADWVTQSFLAPGSAQETAEDREHREALAALPVADPEVPETEVIIDTRTPAANLAARTNIVPDGPGTVGDHLW